MGRQYYKKILHDAVDHTFIEADVAAGEWQTDMSKAPKDVWCIIGFIAPSDGMRIAKTCGNDEWHSSNFGHYKESDIARFAIINTEVTP